MQGFKDSIQGFLAVLPFENLTGDPAQDYFVDGMTDALTTDLAQIGGLQTSSHVRRRCNTSSAKKPLPAIGQELNVDAVVEGAVVRSGQHVRITAQLIHAATDRHVWAQSYEGELSDVLALQQQIARAIAAAIQGRPASPSPAARCTAASRQPGGLRLVPERPRRRGAGVVRRIPHCRCLFRGRRRQAAGLREAYAALAQAQHQFLFGGPLSPRETIPKAEAAARKALQLDETLAQAHRTLGRILHHFYWQWEEGDKEFARARELSSDSA